MLKLVEKQSTKAGLPPGSLVHVSDTPAVSTRIGVVVYDESDVKMTEVDVSSGCPRIEHGTGVTWVRVRGLGNVETLRELGECFGLHPLVLEDILHTDQRPKAETYDRYIYVVARAVRWDAAARETASEQVSIVLGPDFVLSFQESDDDLFGPVSGRLAAGSGRIRRLGPDYLAYALLDFLVDSYFVVLERVGEHMESLEDTVIESPAPLGLQEIHALRRELVALRNVAWPLRDVIAELQRDDAALVSADVRLYLRDAHGHIVQVIDTIGAFTAVAAGLVDLYLSTVSNQMNAVMKVLTIIATLFIPLTFVVGVYGMNFRYMPELAWRWGYPAVLLLMLIIALWMLWHFRRKQWL